MGEEEIRNQLSLYLTISNVIMTLGSYLSFGKRRYSIVEIAITDTEMPLQDFMEKLNDIMLSNEVNYQKMRLMACPDHYLILTTGYKTQEVIETTGGSPFPTQFFITYDDEEGLCSKQDPSYDMQLVGVARTKSGTVIEGVRYQVRKESNGLRVKLLVEFPFLVPNWMIKEHQFHLMCEFNNWIQDILDT
ncbi:hypothetical protein CONCODRAFT_70925 [Conidiobolus coronatus NRRL 28638]|uniref:Uncharacterized protein n=1 Tax=Conidiobolus coronatus (strain ATCC 28846 / CBS 209.66 / NRRL 28638) TaxID=796925 RepID=A0A137P554_CONC2|nr:hypothetical protein CONCODRAFT_70925 [Conidiobolus coronatus NRRL 28638]|eukprot:KXN70135.1 hypothetical protein CONCODRAFT_70925 [Conidiobolus coronatus NRRL 28638]